MSTFKLLSELKQGKKRRNNSVRMNGKVFRKNIVNVHLQNLFFLTSLFILTILFDKCQTKGFEDMNILIKPILQFCMQKNANAAIGMASWPEAFLRMVAPGVGFRFYRPKNRWRPKKECLRCKTNWFSVRKYVMTPQKKVFAYQSVGFRSQKKRNKWCHTPTPLATPLLLTEGAQTNHKLHAMTSSEIFETRNFDGTKTP